MSHITQAVSLLWEYNDLINHSAQVNGDWYSCVDTAILSYIAFFWEADKARVDDNVVVLRISFIIFGFLLKYHCSNMSWYNNS